MESIIRTDYYFKSHHNHCTTLCKQQSSTTAATLATVILGQSREDDLLEPSCSVACFRSSLSCSACPTTQPFLQSPSLCYLLPSFSIASLLSFLCSASHWPSKGPSLLLLLFFRLHHLLLFILILVPTFGMCVYLVFFFFAIFLLHNPFRLCILQFE